MGRSLLEVLEILISVWGAVTIGIHMESCNVDIHICRYTSFSCALRSVHFTVCN